MFALNKSKINLVTMFLCSLLITAGLFVNNYLNIVALVIAFGCMIICGEDFYIYDLFYLLPFAMIFKTSPTSISLFTILQLGIVIILILRHREIEKSFFILAVMYFGYILMGSFLLNSQNIETMEMIKQCSGVFLLYFITKGCRNLDKDSIFYFYVLGVLVSSVVGVFGKNIPNFALYVRQIGIDNNILSRFSGLYGDPNYYAINLVLVMMIGLFIYKNHKGLFWILFVCCSLFGIQTYSRSFILMWAIVLMFIILSFVRERRWSAVALLLAFAIIGLFAFNRGDLRNLSLLLDRFTNFSASAGVTNGRFNLWNEYLTNISGSIQHIFLGHGFSSGLLQGKGVHNFFIELWYYLGLIGVLIFIFLLRACVPSKQDNVKYTIMNVFPLCVLAAMYFFLQMLFSNELIFHIAIVYLLYDSSFEIKNRQESVQMSI